MMVLRAFEVVLALMRDWRVLLLNLEQLAIVRLAVGLLTAGRLFLTNSLLLGLESDVLRRGVAATPLRLLASHPLRLVVAPVFEVFLRQLTVRFFDLPLVCPRLSVLVS